MKRMAHKVHGFTHAYTEQEETKLIANGWVVEEKPVLEKKLTAKKQRNTN